MSVVKSDRKTDLADRLSDRRWTIGIVLFAVALRVAAALVWQYQCSAAGTSLRFGDSHSYWTIARNLVIDGQYQYGSDQSRIFRAPVYPLFLAPFAWSESFTGDEPARVSFVLAARLVGCLLGGLVVWILMRWTTALAGSVAGRFAGVLAATYSGAVGMSIFVLSEAVATPLIVLCCWMLWRSTHRLQGDDKFHRYVWTAGSAVAFGLASLARPSWGLWPAVAFPFLAVASKLKDEEFFRKWFCQGLLFFGVLSAIMLPWWVRNYVVTGKFVPTTLQVGASLYDGWHPGASGSSDENMDFSMKTMARIVQEESVLAIADSKRESTLEWRIDRRLRDEAWGWVRENPSDALTLGLVKFWKTWSPVPTARELSNPLIKWWEAVSYLCILSMSVLGLRSLRYERKRWIDASFMVLPCVYLAMLHMVFVGSVRYRQPGVLMLCGLAGIGVQAVWTKWFEAFRMKQDRNRTDAVGDRDETEQ